MAPKIDESFYFRVDKDFNFPALKEDPLRAMYTGLSNTRKLDQAGTQHGSLILIDLGDCIRKAPFFYLGD